MLDASSDLGGAVRIEAAHGGEFRFAKDLASARRAGVRHLEFLLPARAYRGIDPDHRGNHLAGFFDEDPIADADVLAGDLFLVVQGGAGHAAAGDLHGLKFGHRGEGTHASDLHRNTVEFRPCAFGLVFVSHGPAWGL